MSLIVHKPLQVLLMLAPVLLMFVLPKLMKSMDPEQQKVSIPQSE